MPPKSSSIPFGRWSHGDFPPRWRASSEACSRPGRLLYPLLSIFGGAPYIESVRNNKPLGAALTGITAAVVGVILNLAIWFGLHTLFGQVDERHVWGLSFQTPALNTLNVPALLLSLVAMLALFRFKIGMIPTLIGCSIAG